MASILLTVGALAAGLLLIPELFGDFTAYQIGLYLIYGIAAQGIGLVWGKAGVLPLGQALFFGIGAYVAAAALRSGLSLPVQGLVAVGVIAVLSLAAYALASLVFRGRSESGPYFSLMTLALVLIAEQLASTATPITGGFNGLSGFSAIGGLDAYSELYYLIVAVTVAVAAGLLWLNTRPLSVLMRAVSANEPRVQILGCASHRVKGLVFALSAGLAVVAGGLFASHQGIVTPTASGFALSAELVIFAAIGGRFHVLGPLIGAVVVGWVSAELRDRFSAMEMAMALAFIVVVMRAPGGLAELIATPVARWLPARRTHGVGRVTAPSARRATQPRGLEFASVQVDSGVVRILNGTQFSTPDSGVVCVIGPNGAGKTSVLNAITGHLPLTSGAIRLGGERIDGEPPYRALGQGVGRKLQVPSVFSALSVQENVMLGAMAGRARWRDWFATAPFGWSSPALRAVLDHPDVPLVGAWSQPAGTLPQGHRQYLELAMTLAAEPGVLLLDEPCAGLSPAETALMSALIRHYQRQSGALVIVIEHDMSLVESISDRVVVLHQGETLAEGDYATVRQQPAVQAVYAGATK